MKKAIVKSKKNLEVYVYEDLKPNASYNFNKYVVSKKPNSLYTFCVDKNDIVFI